MKCQIKFLQTHFCNVLKGEREPVAAFRQHFKVKAKQWNTGTDL